MQRIALFINQKEDWTQYKWRSDVFLNLLSEARDRLLGIIESIGSDLKNEAFLSIITLDILKISAIRDINDLIQKVILQKKISGGRSTNYELKRG